MSYAVKNVATSTPVVPPQGANTARPTSLPKPVSPQKDSGISVIPAPATTPSTHPSMKLNAAVAPALVDSKSTPSSRLATPTPTADAPGLVILASTNPSPMEGTEQGSDGPTLVSSALGASPSKQSSTVQPSADVDLRNSAKTMKVLDDKDPVVWPRPGVLTNSSQVPREEKLFMDEIVLLWSSNSRKSVALKCDRLELGKDRAKLGELLHGYKQLLVAAGRGGKWTNFLREHHIPKSTADRYVEKFKLLQSPKAVKLSLERLLRYRRKTSTRWSRGSSPDYSKC